MYPLHQNFIAPISAFIKRLNQHPAIEVHTNHMSTHIYGKYDTVMPILQKEMKDSFLDNENTVMVVKFIGRDVREI
jgi:uncharacterized protein YqgV (UPF0045/DUF77 family)